MRTHPVVGIGASSGGTKALRDFFGSVPEAFQAIYFVCLHLPPDAGNLLGPVLSPTGQARVVELSDTVDLSPGTIVVVPPGVTLRLEGDQAFPVPDARTGPLNRSADMLFRELAEKAGEMAVAVVLSGDLADGSAGIHAVKENLGMVLAQDPTEAEHPSMPEHAVATGMVDQALPAARLAGAIAEYHENLARIRGQADHPVQWDDPQTIAAILDILKDLTGHDFKGYKTSTLARRLQRRMGLRGVITPAEYERVLRDDPSEAKLLFGELLINVTSFFRDPEVWAAFKQHVAAPMVERAGASCPLRAWVAGCSTGEEAYTMAILLAEAFAEARKPACFQVFASDLDEANLAKARRGVYAAGALAELSRERVERFFTKAKGGYQVIDELRERILFARHNVSADPPFSNQDAITCRNMLIYFTPAQQERVLASFHFALREGGALLLGKSEGLGVKENLFKPASGVPKCYVKSERRSAMPPGLRGAPARLPSALPERRGQDQAWHVQRLLLERFAPASVVADQRGDVVHFSGPLQGYLEFPDGAPSANLADLLREGLRVKVQSAVRKALKQEGRVVVDKARALRDGMYHPVRISVEYLREPAVLEGHLLVCFQDLPSAPETPEALRPEEAGHESAVRELEFDLKATKEELRLTVADLESSLAELRTANEELLSMNEEYQSANEEMETSREEAQSLNEELGSVNAQLKDKVQELERTQDDLINFLHGTQVPTLFLDQGLCVRRYTPALEEMAHIRSDAMGLPVADITLAAWDRELAPLCAKVLEDMIPAESEVQSPAGRWYIRRVLPYMSQGHSVGGVLVTYSDVTALKDYAGELEEAKALFEAVVNQSPVPMVIVSRPDGRIRAANKAFRDVLELGEDALAGRSLKEMAAHWEIHDAGGRVLTSGERPLALALAGERTDYEERKIVLGGGARKWVLVGTAPVVNGKGNAVAGIVVFVDITERKRMEQEILRAKEAAEAANNTKTEFLAMMSHEIRTPMNGILGALQVLRESEMPKAQELLIRMALESSHNLMRILGDILDLSCMEANRFSLAREPFGIDEVVLPVMQAFSHEARRKGVRLRSTVSEGLPRSFTGDPVRFRQILFNLVGNAVKFTHEGEVSLEISPLPACYRPGKRCVLVTVKDTGIGIGDDLLATVFEPFVQGESGNRRLYCGTGLGLTLVKRFVSLMDGRLTVESEPGRGSAFHVVLPLDAGPVGLERGSDRRFDGRGRRVLVVEDEGINRMAVIGMLERFGCRAEGASDAAEALEMLADRAFDCVLMDVSLPGMSGLEATRELRASLGPNRDVPVVACTAHAMEGDRERFLAEGMNDYVPKPIDMAVLEEVLERVMGAAGADAAADQGS